MRRLSSKSTWWYKRGFPTLWYAALALPIVTTDYGRQASGFNFLAWLAMGAMMVGGYIVMRRWCFPLVDGVFEADGGLVVFNKGEARKIFFRDIEQFHEISPSKPGQVVVTFKTSSGAKEEFRFVPEANPLRDIWRRNRVVEELAVKVTRARAQPGTGEGDALGRTTSSTQPSFSDFRDSRFTAV